MSDIIDIRGLYKSYGKKEVLKNVNITLSAGKIVGLLGPNGSGKTTLIKILNGLLKDYEGHVSIDDMKVGHKTKAIVSYLPDEPYFENWMTTSDAIHLFKDMYKDFNEEKMLSLMERLKIEEKVKIKSLSKGMQERFQLALVMSREAKVYILDEPIGGVDPASRDVILDTILNNYDSEALILLSTHLISDIENIFDEVIFLKEGEVILHEDSEQLRASRNASINTIFKEEFRC